MTSDDPRRRPVLARLGAAAAVASAAGCLGDGDGDSDGGEDESDDTDGSEGPDGSDGTDGGTDGTDGTDGTGDDTDDGTEDPPHDVEQRILELRAILKEFPGAYDDGVLDQAMDVRDQHRDSVVFVNLQEEPVPHRLATGWFVDTGRVLTTKRKLGTLDTVPVHTVDGTPHEAEIVERHDGVENLALLDLPVDGTPIDRSRTVSEPPEPNTPLVQIGHHDEYGHWVPTMGDYIRTETFDAYPEYIDEHVSNIPGLPGVGGAPVFTLDGELIGMTNGRQPREPLARGEAPEPLNDYVYDWQMSHREWLNHLAIEQTLEEIEDWL